MSKVYTMYFSESERKWIDSIVGAVAGAVLASDPSLGLQSDFFLAVADEQHLRALIESACDLERAAILSGDLEEARKMGDRADALNVEFQQLIEAKSAALASRSMQICGAVGELVLAR